MNEEEELLKEYQRINNPQKPSEDDLIRPPTKKTRYRSGEGSQDFLNKSLQVGASLAPDPTNPAEMSELFMDLKSGMNAAKMAPGGPMIKGVAGVAGFGASRVARTVVGEAIDDILNTARRWVDGKGWVAQTAEGVNMPWNDRWWMPSENQIVKTHMMAQAADGGDSSINRSQTRDWSKYERDEAAYFLEERWPRDKEFNELGDLIKSELKTLYPDIPLSYWRRHHTNPLKQGAQLLNGLEPEFRKKGVQIMFQEGLSAGHNPEQLAVIPHKIHVKIHNFINQSIGKDTVANLERTWLKPGQKLKDIPWDQREGIIRAYAKTVKESNHKIYDMMTALAVNKKYGPNVLPEVLANLNSKVNATDIGLDDLLKQVKSELGFQSVTGATPQIDILKLAQQWENDPIKLEVLKAKINGATNKQLKKQFGKSLDIKQLDIFKQISPQQMQMLQNRYKLGGKAGPFSKPVDPL